MSTKRRKTRDVTNDFLKFSFTIKDFKFTEKQRKLLKIIKDPNTKVVFVEGVAGTAKTLCSVYAGLGLLKDGAIDKIKFIRALVESSQSKIGYLKGSLEEKTSPYSAPLMDKLEELLHKSDADKLLLEGSIESICPNFLRGTTFRNEYVIVDEAQELCYKDLVTILTRIGENSKLIIAGDVFQSDIRNEGFSRMMDVFNDHESVDRGIHYFAFGPEDIMRSEILKFIMSKLQK